MYKKIIIIIIVIVYAALMLQSITQPVRSAHVSGLAWYLRFPLHIYTADSFANLGTLDTKLPDIDYHFAAFYRTGISLIALALIAAVWLFPLGEISRRILRRRAKEFAAYQFKSYSKLQMLSLRDQKTHLVKYLSIIKKAPPRSILAAQIEILQQCISLLSHNEEKYAAAYITWFTNITELQSRYRAAYAKKASTTEAFLQRIW